MTATVAMTIAPQVQNMCALAVPLPSVLSVFTGLNIHRSFPHSTTKSVCLLACPPTHLPSHLSVHMPCEPTCFVHPAHSSLHLWIRASVHPCVEFCICSSPAMRECACICVHLNAAVSPHACLPPSTFLCACVLQGQVVPPSVCWSMYTCVSINPSMYPSASRLTCPRACATSCQCAVIAGVQLCPFFCRFRPSGMRATRCVLAS